jgi:2-phospho-L-lactate guanylyltransferase (CobY/MobA/RfbA family)
MVKMLTKPDPSFELRSEAVAHLEEHRRRGHRVLDIAFINLRREIDEKGDLVKVVVD